MPYSHQRLRTHIPYPYIDTLHSSISFQHTIPGTRITTGSCLLHARLSQWGFWPQTKVPVPGRKNSPIFPCEFWSSVKTLRMLESYSNKEPACSTPKVFNILLVLGWTQAATPRFLQSCPITHVWSAFPHQCDSDFEKKCEWVVQTRTRCQGARWYLHPSPCFFAAFLCAPWLAWNSFGSLQGSNTWELAV